MRGSEKQKIFELVYFQFDSKYKMVTRDGIIKIYKSKLLENVEAAGSRNIMLECWRCHGRHLRTGANHFSEHGRFHHLLRLFVFAESLTGMKDITTAVLSI